jgi:hypothetical protein
MRASSTVTASTPPADPNGPTQPARRLDRKLAAIAAGRSTPADFILADAKDADMAFGVAAPGPVPGTPPDGRGKPGFYRTREAYLAAMRDGIRGGHLDIMLTSASNGERLVRDGWPDPAVTLAIRGNDTTDIWLPRGATVAARPSRPFRTVDLARIRPFCDLVLYSVTLNNDLDHDLATVQAYRAFRHEAAALGVRHFLEVFNPNAPTDLTPADTGAFINDWIIRILAGVTADERPAFLKVVYNGADALAELVEHDPTLVVGILGGSAGTTRDTFELLRRAEEHGARVALFGRKIQGAESQGALVGLMREVLEHRLDPVAAVRAYHVSLARQGLAPVRPLEADLELTDPVLRAE